MSLQADAQRSRRETKATRNLQAIACALQGFGKKHDIGLRNLVSLAIALLAFVTALLGVNSMTAPTETTRKTNGDTVNQSATGQVDLSSLQQLLNSSVVIEPPQTNSFILRSEASKPMSSDVVENDWLKYSGAGNEGVGLRDPSTITVRSNVLNITATGDTSGGMQQRFSQTYGRYVVRMRMDAGAGYGPAILLWPVSEIWPDDGEIDMIEMPHGDRQSAVLTTHFGIHNSQLSKTVSGDFTDWHTIVVDWLPGVIIYYIDGKETFRITRSEAIPSKPMNLAIQNDVGACNSWIGCRNASTPQHVALQVSDVKVYSYTGDTSN